MNNDRDLASADFVAQLERTVERLRTMSLTKLERTETMEHAHIIMQQCADAALQGSGLDTRSVPKVKAATLADQLLVLGRDAMARSNADRLEELSKALLEFRRTL